MTTPSSNTQSNAQGSFGATLQQARKNKKVTIDEAAAELFILKRHLQALESEDFSDLPQPAFARGFAINYAKYLGLDPIKIASSFDAAYPNELKVQASNSTDTPLRPMGTLQRDTHNRIRFNPLLILAVIGVIVLAVFLFRMVSHASKEHNEEPVSTVEDISASEQAQGAAISSTSDIGSSGSALNLGDANASEAALAVTVTDTANVTITDAAGNDLMTGAQTSGNYSLSGMPPFNVQIDNIDNVSLMLDQEAVALDTYATDKKASFEHAP